MLQKHFLLNLKNPHIVLKQQLIKKYENKQIHVNTNLQKKCVLLENKRIKNKK